MSESAKMELSRELMELLNAKADLKIVACKVRQAPKLYAPKEGRTSMFFFLPLSNGNRINGYQEVLPEGENYENDLLLLRADDYIIFSYEKIQKADPFTTDSGQVIEYDQYIGVNLLGVLRAEATKFVALADRKPVKPQLPRATQEGGAGSIARRRDTVAGSEATNTEATGTMADEDMPFGKE
jgi:hypothetical protein